MVKLYFKNITTEELKLISIFPHRQEFDKYVNFFKIEAGKSGCIVHIDVEDFPTCLDDIFEISEEMQDDIWKYEE